MPPPRRKRCTFKEHGRRCPRDGDGDPPLCRPHMLALAEATRPRSPVDVLTSALGDFMAGRRINAHATIGAAETLYQQWAAGLGGDYRPDVGEGASEHNVHRAREPRNTAASGTPWWAPGDRTPPPAPPDPGVLAALRARQVLGFTAKEPLTPEMIRDRRRRLALRHHPDRGGSEAKMATVNDAADVLLGNVVG